MRHPRPSSFASFAFAVPLLAACAPQPPRLPPALELVESAPLESGLDHPDVPDTHDVWREMFSGARRTVDIAQFYVSDAPGSRLGPVLHALAAATVRGVRVRLLVDASFAKKYPDVLSELEGLSGLEVRRASFGDGGVMHAKYFVVDGAEAFVGSANFDWRSLTHVQELGVRVRIPKIAAALSEVFEADWRRAGAGEGGERGEGTSGREPASPPAAGIDAPQGHVAAMPVLAARETLPDPRLWDLPKLIDAIDRAKRRVRVQVLKYDTRSRDGAPFPHLDRALRRAAARGVRVELLISDWSTDPGALPALRALARERNVEIRVASIPRFSGGFIPFSRTIHAKYMTVDGERAWLGSSNWEGDYFFRGRNAGLLFDGAAFVSRLDRVFGDLWTSPHARPFDPTAAYEPPILQAP